MIEQHPKLMLKPEWVSDIEKCSAEAEEKRQLTATVLQLIYDCDWFRILIPEKYGGKEWPLPKAVALFEALAWADGNVGWCVNLGAGANMFAGYLDPETARGIFSHREVCCAGSGAVSGVATRVTGGYQVSGYWKYASGAAHATHFTANCYLHDAQGKPVEEAGSPAFRSFLFPRSSVTVKDTWKVTGLKATSSHDFEVTGIFVPDALTFSLQKPSEHAVGPLYQFPFSALAVVNMAVMPLGIAWRFLDLFESLIHTKKMPGSQSVLSDSAVLSRTFADLRARFMAERHDFFDKLERAWQQVAGGIALSKKQEDALCHTAVSAAATARKVVFELFPYSGMSGVFSDSPVNKAWRDLAVAGQHYLLSPMHEDAD